tara:strand:- start:4311 stop:4607 length:297 start_codon:yes stop_codon:yes gene_type:complete
MELYNDISSDFYSLEQNISYNIKEVDDVVETETYSVFDRITNISTKELLKVMFMIHFTIVVLILASYYDNKSSINYSITRLQLLVVIFSLWTLLYCFC